MLPLQAVGLVTPHPSLIFVSSRPRGPSVWTSGVRGGLAMSRCPERYTADRVGLHGTHRLGSV